MNLIFRLCLPAILAVIAVSLRGWFGVVRRQGVNATGDGRVTSNLNAMSVSLPLLLWIWFVGDSSLCLQQEGIKGAVLGGFGVLFDGPACQDVFAKMVLLWAIYWLVLQLVLFVSMAWCAAVRQMSSASGLAPPRGWAIVVTDWAYPVGESLIVLSIAYLARCHLRLGYGAYLFRISNMTGPSEQLLGLAAQDVGVALLLALMGVVGLVVGRLGVRH